MNVRRIDWCDYIFQCAKGCKKGWRRDNCFFAGPITFLTLLYVDSTLCKRLAMERSRPVVLHWTSELLKEREQAKKFWEARIAKRYIPSSVDESTEKHDDNNGKNSMNNVLEDEPSNVLGYVTRVNTMFKEIIAKKKT